MTTRPSARPAADRLWELVPGWTQFRDRRDGQNLIRTLIDALGVGLDAVHSDLLRLLDDMFVETCDPRLVPLIGDLVGVSVDPAIPVARQRHQVKYALHLRRRKGTVEQLEMLGWQITGFRTKVIEAPSAQRTVFDPRASARFDEVAPTGGRAADISGRVPPGGLAIHMDVAWPVRRTQLELQPMGSEMYNIYAVDPSTDIGFRRADGTPIFRSDDPRELVGRDCPIDLTLLGADFPVLGKLKPKFMSLPNGAALYIPDHTLAIDPERGHIAGPTSPAQGIRAFRRYQLQFWQAMRGELVEGAPTPIGEGIFAFSPDARMSPLTDEEGIPLLLGFEGEPNIPQPRKNERLLLVREPAYRRHGRTFSPFVLLPPHQALDPSKPASEQGGLLLDGPGLNRFFSIRDDFCWDLFRNVRLVSKLGQDLPPDDTVEVDLAHGRFRVGPAHAQSALHVRFFRRYELSALKRRGEEAMRGALPLGRSAKLVFRDTAPGSIEESRL